MTAEENRYARLIEQIFLDRYKKGMSEVPFERIDIISTAERLGIVLPKNLGDVVYSFRYRTNLPASVVAKAKEGTEWIIRSAGRSKYKLVLTNVANFTPNPALIKIKIPDSTPGVVARYAIDDEQALLAKIRYNRLIDVFTGVTSYSLQNHLRTTIRDMGQVETDEVYIGVDKQGVHYVFTVQAKGGKDRIGAVQIEQDFMVCSEKFPAAVGRPIAAQFMDDLTIVLFEFVQTEEGVRVADERHYLLVHPDNLTTQELADYRKRTS
jgi:hypothetical protein